MHALGYSVGIAVPLGKPEFRDAIMAALVELQKAGIETTLLKRWGRDTGTIEAPKLVQAR